MCLIIFAHQVRPETPLIVAANRDEFHTRPSQPAAFWDDEYAATGILAGRDLVGGGTWLGITASGRFAAVTNIRDPSQAELKPRSRGELTRDFLAGTQSPGTYCDRLRAHFNEFAGFNLLVGDRESLYYVNNFAERIEALAPGIYGLSNGQINNDWPKVKLGRARLAQLLEDPGTLDSDNLLALMSDREAAADEQLPDTGIPRELERKLSSAFIVNSERHYGTCCSTAVIRSADGGLRFSERNFDRHGEPASSHFYALPADAACASRRRPA